MENTSRVRMVALSNPLDINHEEARLRHADGVTPRTAFHVMPSDTVHDHFVERDGLRFAGTHLIIDLWEASNRDDIEVVEKALRDAAAAAGTTPLKIDLHSFTPSGGITGAAVLAESHISFRRRPPQSSEHTCKGWGIGGALRCSACAVELSKTDQWSKDQNERVEKHADASCVHGP
jgi:S-adenosylmethionine decarboxylase